MSFKDIFDNLLSKRNIYIIGWTLFIASLIAVVTYIARTKLYAPDGEIDRLAKYLKSQSIQVQSAVTTKEINTYALVDFHIAGSYNTCCSINTIDNEVSLEPLKMVLKRGIRVVDFEIYMLPNRSVVIASGHNPLKITTQSECYDTTITQKGSYNHVNITQAFNMINAYGFSVAPNSLDPIFINLRIKTKEPAVFDVLKKELHKAFSNRLLPSIYAQEGKLVKPQRKKIELMPLKDLKGKVVIMVEDFCENYKDNNEFYQLVNLSVSGNLRKETSDGVKTRKGQDYTEKNKDKLALVVPDDTHPATQLSSSACRAFGVQFIMMNYGLAVDSLKDHMKFFREKGTQIVLKEKDMRRIRTTTKKPIQINKTGEGLNKTKKRVDPTTGKSYTF